MSALRAGVVGLGSIGRHHVRVLRSLPGVELVAVADAGGDPSGVAQGLPVLPDVDALCATGVDLAVVAVPTAHHEPVALALARAGVHALVEKPLAPDVESAQRIARAFSARGLVGAVGHLERYNPALLALRARLDDGHLGALHQISTRRQGPFPGRISDVGVVMDLATHDIDLTGWVAGSAFRSVSARTAHRSGREHEDVVLAVGDLADGTITSHVVDWLSPVKERTTYVLGERGALLANTLTGDLTFHANGSVEATWDAVATFRGVSEGDVVRFAIPKPEPLVSELSAFCAAVAGRPGAHGVVTMDEGVRTVRVAAAVLEAAATGQSVRLPPTEDLARARGPVPGPWPLRPRRSPSLPRG
ncbi:Gfo/Idh/MocA family protein [Quadrisphaera sp. DSM 44207]|uniref:Gfo/Idh/MocA family protein n=1 Tax=Quadrisphaera sp. DSM 44207 TaxID=1881057 RepID=UPI00088252EE|nr:Gfo/Idh/MocA family oxidoreductase [Quadrisphaera sp. DSM 44207]SDQ20375.1 Predicted dehydrogenase [Quadrisphaera sp. DSM 44207]